VIIPPSYDTRDDHHREDTEEYPLQQKEEELRIGSNSSFPGRRLRPLESTQIDLRTIAGAVSGSVKVVIVVINP